MTLLESVVALVIVGMAAVGFLNLFEGDARIPVTAREWNAAVSYAEEGMELAKLGQPVPTGNSTGLSRRVERKFRAKHVDEIQVVVTLDGGRTFVLRRLVSAR